MDVYCRSNISALNKWKKDTSVCTHTHAHTTSHTYILTYKYEHTHTPKYTEVFSNNC